MDVELMLDLQDLNSNDDSSSVHEEQNFINQQYSTDISSLLSVYNSPVYSNTLSAISNAQENSLDTLEYSLIQTSNNLASDIDHEISNIYQYVKDIYNIKFPELQSLILSPIDYAKTIKLIQNATDITAVDLKSLLPSATVMVISVTWTTTLGSPLNDLQLTNVLHACDVIISLDDAKSVIIDYVQSRMNLLAPNTTAILGSATAAKLMGAAGGLSNLSNIPACNIMVIGAGKKTNVGLSSVMLQKHAGIIYNCDLIANTPAEFKRKAARVISAKVALASRVDCAKESLDGTIGNNFREDITKKIELMLQPLAGKHTKALPLPDDGPKKRRGGKKVRKAKERNGVTELSKAQNRMSFGVAEEEVGYSMGETMGLGQLGQGTGKIRIQTDARHKVGLAKKYANKTYGGNSVSGLSSSVAFTPVKGIELENPEAKVKQANEKYFSSGYFNKPL